MNAHACTHTNAHTHMCVVEVGHLWVPVSQDFSHSMKVRKKIFSGSNS